MSEMKQISEITGAVQNGLATNSMRLQDATLKKTGLPTSWVSALFKRFQARYGQKFTSSIEGIEELAADEWSEGLAGLIGAQIKKGLVSWAGDWPPSLPEFKAACLGADDWEHKGDAYKPFQKALPAPLCKKEIAQAEREKLRKLGIKV